MHNILASFSNYEKTVAIELCNRLEGTGKVKGEWKRQRVGDSVKNVYDEEEIMKRFYIVRWRVNEDNAWNECYKSERYEHASRHFCKMTKMVHFLEFGEHEPTVYTRQISILEHEIV